ncbi:hypothetical protein MKI84_13710 [Ancylobacter sp. A5.8]|uniref:hypothetical protein n=1 Tax=Ancylobacter gelatini TaxID=2919920 RepID=UPI001F4E1B1A|nr:hypothetical protein [Ancylobacter gelatini]MCJ8143975.1 hypothetical protein [Ancylobacter gelatini]
MPVFLVTFDLRDSGNAENLIEAIKQTSWTQFTPTSFAVSTAETDEALFFRLRPFTSDGDSLYVSMLKKPYRGMGFREVNYWLEENLRY